MCSGQNTHLILSTVKPRHGEITAIPNNMGHYTSFNINDVAPIGSCQFMLSSLDKISSKLSKDQFRETRKYLEPFYVQQLNQPQTNNMTGWIRGWSDVRPWRLSKPPLLTTNTHVRSATTNWRRLGVDNTKSSLPIWVYGLLWTISRTTVTTQRRLL